MLRNEECKKVWYLHFVEQQQLVGMEASDPKTARRRGPCILLVGIARDRR